MAYNYETKSYLAYARGVDFAKAAKILEECDTHVMIPQIVNAAFSCELMLKAIIIAEKKREERFSEHKLSQLFSMMRPETQAFIKRNSNIFDWDGFMQKSSNAFVEWRYLHEEDKVMFISVSDLQRLYSSLKDYYEATYPLATIVEWKE